MLYILPVLLGIALLVYIFLRRTLLRSKRKRTQSQENAQLLKVLLGLDEERKDQLFTLYKEEFGDGAARYARQTYQKWKDGSVRPNRQTFRRFLINLPKVMSFDLKCEVVRELREVYCEQSHYRASVSTNDWKSSLEPIVETMIQKAKTAELPQALSRRLTWLAENDAVAANKLLAESEGRQAADTLALLQTEFSNIESLLNNTRGDGKVTHVVRLPVGTITLDIKRG